METIIFDLLFMLVWFVAMKFYILWYVQAFDLDDIKGSEPVNDFIFSFINNSWDTTHWFD